MELPELFNVIQSTLASAGFKLYPGIQNSMTRSIFVMDQELLRVPLAGSQYTVFSGICMEVRVVPHRNGAKEDTSYYLAIQDVRTSSFKDYKKIKLMRSQEAPTLVRKINKLVVDYYMLLRDRRLSNRVDEILDMMLK